MPVLDRLPRLAELALEGARKAGSAGANAARGLAGEVRRRRQAQDRAPAAPADTPAPAEPAAKPDPVTEAVPEPTVRPAAGEPAPDHVDREAVVVAESHDPGATGSVGAQITVDEPWEGYGELSPREVVAQLEDATAEKLAVVRMYEGLHRNDRGVLAAIDRRMAALDG